MPPTAQPSAPVGDLTQGTVRRAILRFMYPLLIGNLLQQTYQLADSAVVGQLLGKEALAAVSASFFIYYFIISLIIGVGSGITVVVSQSYGARQYDRVQRAFSTFFLFMVVAGVVLSGVGIAGARRFFELTGTPPDVVPQALRYFNVYIGGTTVFIVFNSVISTLRGIGDSVRPMLFILLSVALNIAFDLLFILVFGCGVEGVALATIVAQAISLVVAVSYIRRHHRVLSFRRADFVFDRRLLAAGLKIGLPTSIQQCAIAVGLIALLEVVNRFGADALTAYGAAGKIDALVTQAVLTSASALAAFCGQNIGAAALDRVRAGVRFVMQMNLIFCLGVYIILYLFADGLMTLFTADAQVVAIGRRYLLVTGSCFVVHGALNILNGAMRGAGDTLFAMLTGIVAFWLVRIPAAWLASDRWGTTGIWWAINLSISVAFVATLFYYRSGRWKRRIVSYGEPPSS